ncbi:hypothetical protein ACFL7M_12825, partial [Thermodesulfobacteriota bacterium]
KKDIETLIGVFQDIDAGDRLSIEKPETARNLGMAIRFYNRAEQKAKDLPSNINIEFITELKTSVSLDRKAMLETRNKELRAEGIYSKIITSLKPLEWEKGRMLLYGNQQFIMDHLDQERKDVVERLIAFFSDINEGDRLINEQPETEKGLDAASIYYQQAGEKAEALPDIIDVSFISEQKIKEGIDLKSRLEIKNKKALALERYNQIISELKPGKWENGKKLLIDNRQFISEYLDDNFKVNVESLIGFFKDIEEGDRFSAERPENEKRLENALTFYKRAGQKAKDLPDNIDIVFITEKRINRCQNNLKALQETKQRELLAAKEEKVTLKEPVKEPKVEIIGQGKLPDKEYDRDTTILLALKEFDAKDYTSSWNHFMKVFSKQINRIKTGGKKRVYGVLALPVECRAEVFFLIELDKLKNNNNNKFLIQEGLEQILERIDNREGLWVIIRDKSRRDKIKRHIEVFNIGYLQ